MNPNEEAIWPANNQCETPLADLSFDWVWIWRASVATRIRDAPQPIVSGDIFFSIAFALAGDYGGGAESPRDDLHAGLAEATENSADQKGREVMDTADPKRPSARLEAAPETGQRQTAKTKVLLFDAKSDARAAHGVGELGNLKPTDEQLLWVDVLDPDEAELRELARALSLPDESIQAILAKDSSPLLRNCGACFWLRVVAVSGHDGTRFQGRCLTVIAGKNLVVSVHQDPIDFIEEMPRDPNGKLYKRRLRDPYWEGREKAI